MKRFLNSVGFALRGIRFVLSGENFRIQCVIGLLVTGMGIMFNITAGEWLWIIAMIGLVLAAEMFNSAVENIVNFISPEFNPLAGKIKDLAAGAVLVIAFASFVVGLIIFIPYLNIF